MRAALRATTALLLAAPLALTAVPASTAASQSLYKASGSFSDLFYEGPMDSATIPGNYVFLQFSVHDDFADGFVDAFDCADGEVPFGDEGEEGACEYLGFYYLFGDGVNVTKAKGKGKTGIATVSGSVDLYAFDDETGSDELVAEDLPVDFTLTPTGATSRTTITDVYRDPVNGVSYRYRETQTTQIATASGSVVGIDVDGADGRIGTYRLHTSERIA